MVRLIPSLYQVTRDNEFISDLTPYVLSGHVSFNPDRRIKWMFEGEISQDADLASFNDYIAPHLTVEYPDGHIETSQFGVYSLMPPQQTITQTRRTFGINSRDLTWQLDNSVFDNGYTLDAGQNIVSAVRSLLSGYRHTIPDRPTTLPTTKSWKAGTSRLTVINDLLNMTNMYTLYMSKDGRLASMEYVADSNKSPMVEYSAPSFNRVQIIRDIHRDTTPDRIKNKIVVIGGTSIEEPIIATAINNSPASPTSYPNIGYWISDVREGVQVADQASADALAQRLLDEASQEYHRLTLVTTPDVSIEPYMVYRLNIVHPSTGEVVVDGVWNSRGWSLGFTPESATHEHELSNIDAPPQEV